MKLIQELFWVLLSWEIQKVVAKFISDNWIQLYLIKTEICQKRPKLHLFELKYTISGMQRITWPMQKVNEKGVCWTRHTAESWNHKMCKSLKVLGRLQTLLTGFLNWDVSRVLCLRLVFLHILEGYCKPTVKGQWLCPVCTCSASGWNLVYKTWSVLYYI